MRRVAWLALLLLPWAPAEAQEEVILEWSYTFAVPDPASGLVRVTLSIAGGEGAVTRFTFVTRGHREPVTNVTAGTTTALRETDAGFEVTVDGVESFSYDVEMERPAFKPGEVLAHVGEDFALFKAESATLPYTYQFFAGRTFRNLTRVRLEPPLGWNATGPWQGAGVREYFLPADEVLPRGFVVMGRFEPESLRLGNTDVTYVRLGDAAPFEPDLPEYVERATPYYRAVYGSTPPRVLIVSAPDPMFRGGLGATASLFVHESADLRTFAHEYAHVHQRFGTQEAPGASSIWLSEGDADWHSALSLHAADLWSTLQVQEFLDTASADRGEPAFADVALPDVTYGMVEDGRSLERFAYHKGQHVLRALDEELAEAGGVSELLRRLNARHGDATSDDASRAVENDEILEVASAIAGRSLSTFFSRYVQGTEWPDAPRFLPEGDLGVERIDLRPPQGVEGERVNVTARVVSRGTREVTRDVQLLVDGEVVDAQRVSLDVGATALLGFSILVGAPGDHEVRVLHETVTLRSLLPARLALGQTSLLPTTPRAGATADLLVFVDNLGEQPGSARVQVVGANRTLATSPERIVPGLATEVVTLPLRLDEPGSVDVDVILLVGEREELRRLRVTVAPPDADGDGVADADDSYPENPSLWDRTLGNDIKDVSMGAAIVLSAIVAGAVLRRRC